MQKPVPDVCDHAQRHRLLTDLLEEGGPQPITPRYDDENPSPETIQIDTVEMHHIHLPMLDDYKFIEWEPGDDFVIPGDNLEDYREEIMRYRCVAP